MYAKDSNANLVASEKLVLELRQCLDDCPGCEKSYNTVCFPYSGVYRAYLRVNAEFQTCLVGLFIRYSNRENELFMKIMSPIQGIGQAPLEIRTQSIVYLHLNVGFSDQATPVNGLWLRTQ